MITAIHISIHSWVDLITNSSSELFISAGNGTVTTAKAILEIVAELQGKKFDDMFEVKLVHGVRHYEFTNDEDEIFETGEDLRAFKEKNKIGYYSEGLKEWDILRITSKAKTNQNAMEQLAKQLEKLGLTYSAEEYSSG